MHISSYSESVKIQHPVISVRSGKEKGNEIKHVSFHFLRHVAINVLQGRALLLTQCLLLQEIDLKCRTDTLISVVTSAVTFGVPIIKWNWLPPALYDPSGGNLLWLNFGVHAAKLWEWLLPFKGKVLHRLSKIPGSEQQLHLSWEDNELPCGPHKKWTAQNVQELQHHVLTLVFFLQDVFDGQCTQSLHCRRGMEMSLPAHGPKWVL